MELAETFSFREGARIIWPGWEAKANSERFVLTRTGAGAPDAKSARTTLVGKFEAGGGQIAGATGTAAYQFADVSGGGSTLVASVEIAADGETATCRIFLGPDLATVVQEAVRTEEATPWYPLDGAVVFERSFDEYAFDGGAGDDLAFSFGADACLRLLIFDDKAAELPDLPAGKRPAAPACGDRLKLASPRRLRSKASPAASAGGWVAAVAKKLRALGSIVGGRKTYPPIVFPVPPAEPRDPLPLPLETAREIFAGAGFEVVSDRDFDPPKIEIDKDYSAKCEAWVARKAALEAGASPAVYFVADPTKALTKDATTVVVTKAGPFPAGSLAKGLYGDAGKGGIPNVFETKSGGDVRNAALAALREVVPNAKCNKFYIQSALAGRVLVVTYDREADLVDTLVDLVTREAVPPPAAAPALAAGLKAAPRVGAGADFIIFVNKNGEMFEAQGAKTLKKQDKEKNNETQGKILEILQTLSGAEVILDTAAPAEKVCKSNLRDPLATKTVKVLFAGTGNPNRIILTADPCFWYHKKAKLVIFSKNVDPEDCETGENGFCVMGEGSNSENEIRSDLSIIIEKIADSFKGKFLSNGVWVVPVDNNLKTNVKLLAAKIAPAVTGEAVLPK